VQDLKSDKFISRIEGDPNYSEMLVSVLVVVHKKKVALFEENYYKFLIDFNSQNFESWYEQTGKLVKE